MSQEAQWIDSDPFFCRLRDRLQRLQSRRLMRVGFTPAAVMLLLWRHDETPHLLFIRRSDHVRHHKGEISFPGGQMDPEDGNLLQTAVREVHEEVGVRPDGMAILGQLDDAFTFSRYVVTPYAAALQAPDGFQPNAEISELIPLPVQRLLHPDRFSMTFRNLMQDTVAVYTYEFDRKIIWGATARILRSFLDLLRENRDLIKTIEGS